MRQLQLLFTRVAVPTVEFAQRSPWGKIPLSNKELREACEELDRTLQRDAKGGPRRYHLHGKRRVSVSVGPDSRGGVLLDMHWALLLDIERSSSMIVGVLVRGRYPAWTSRYLSDLASSPAVCAGLPKPRGMRLEPQGEHVDLAVLRDQCLARLPELEGPAAARLSIGWGRRARGRKQSRIRLGSARLEEQSIVIHPVLDSPDVPEWVTEYVVHHELCHFAAPPMTREEAAALNEHRLHHSGFRALESRFPMAEEASAWTRKNLRSLLAARDGSRKL